MKPHTNLRTLSGSLLAAACSRLRSPAAPMTRLEPVTARAEGRLAVVTTCTCHVSRVTCHVYRHESPHLDGVGDHDVCDADEAHHHGAGQLDGLVEEEQGADP